MNKQCTLKILSMVVSLCFIGRPFPVHAALPAKPRGEEPPFVITPPPAGYNDRIKKAMDSGPDFFWNEIASKPEGATYENVKDFLAPLKYVNTKWRYIGLIFSPKGSTQKMRVMENGFRVDANLTRRTPLDTKNYASCWTSADTYVTVCVGPKDEIFGLDESRQGQPSYEEGYLPILHVDYTSEGTTYEETVLAHPLIAEYRSPLLDEPGIAAYVRVTAKSGPGQVSFEVVGPPVAYGFPIVEGGYRNDRFVDGHNNAYAFFSAGGAYDDKAKLIRYNLKKGESVYVALPHQLQLAGTRVKADAENFEKARADVMSAWKQELAKGGQLEVPEKVVMDAYRSLLIGDWQLSIGDELPYGMFSYYQGNGYAETLQYIAPYIEFGYFEDARRFIQPIIEYPLSDTGIGLHVCDNRIVLATYYYFMSGDREFILKNKDRLVEVADYLLSHRKKDSGLLEDGYGFDVAEHRIINLNTNSNGWRAIRDLALALDAVGEKELAKKYRAEAESFGKLVRAEVEKSIDRSTNPPFVPFALGEEKPYKSLVESRPSTYYNIVFPYFFESEIYEPKSDPYTCALEYKWANQGVMAGTERCDTHLKSYASNGIHPLYTWGRQFSQISRHEVKRAIYTFYCALAHGYTRGTFVTGECQQTLPSEKEWYRGTYLPPEPPANALLLRSIRHMLAHEHDRNTDGIYDELWLLSCAPQAWLEDGKSIKLDKLATRFGPVSLNFESKLKEGKLNGEITLSERAANKDILLFVRLPQGYTLKKAFLEDKSALKQQLMDGDPVLSLPAKAGTTRFVVEVSK